MTDFEVYQLGWDDGKDNNCFRPEYCDNDHYRRGFCNGAYFRAITPNNACTPTVEIPLQSEPLSSPKQGTGIEYLSSQPHSG